MDVIYSRNRIKLPKIAYKKFKYPRQDNNRKKVKIILVIIISILTFTMVIRSITPVFTVLCKDKAKSMATIICNEETTKIINNYEYDDLVTIYKDENGNITMMKSNIIPINKIISDVAEKIQKRINETEQEEIGIRLGSFLGSKIFSGRGPLIPIKLSTSGNVQTDLRSEFKAVGINQTIHRIYLQIDCDINILTAYTDTVEKISNQVLIAENVIVGQIPSTYYNLEGLNADGAIETIQ